MKILVITEQRQGKWNNTSFETLAAAQQIAASVGQQGAGMDQIAVAMGDILRLGHRRNPTTANAATGVEVWFAEQEMLDTIAKQPSSDNRHGAAHAVPKEIK